jgi:hypothetical protein
VVASSQTRRFERHRQVLDDDQHRGCGHAGISFKPAALARTPSGRRSRERGFEGFPLEDISPEPNQDSGRHFLTERGRKPAERGWLLGRGERP